MCCFSQTLIGVLTNYPCKCSPPIRNRLFPLSYYKLAEQLNGLKPGAIQVPTQRSEVTIVGDSLQLSLPGASKEQLSYVVDGKKKIYDFQKKEKNILSCIELSSQIYFI